MLAPMVELLYFADKDVFAKLSAAVKAARRLTMVSVVPPHRATKNAQRQEPFASIEKKFGTLVNQILVVDEGTEAGMWRDPVTDLADELFPNPKKAYQAARGYFFVQKGEAKKIVKRFGSWDDDVWFLQEALSQMLPGEVEAPNPKKKPGVFHEKQKRVGGFIEKPETTDTLDSENLEPGATLDLEGSDTMSGPSATGRRDAFTALGLDASATFAEARGAYKRLVAQYHPDKVAHLPPEFKELAARRSRELREAFEAVKAELEE
ncbi:MAG: hypothetical protein QM723_21645 [Myxococcaceae bacterium]